MNYEIRSDGISHLKAELHDDARELQCQRPHRIQMRQGLQTKHCVGVPIERERDIIRWLPLSEGPLLNGSTGSFF